MQCKICGGSMTEAFKGRILSKYDVTYFRCTECDFMCTEQPYWLEEAYSSAISDLDLGPVNRAVTGAHVVENVILYGFDPNASFIDWGGGYGIFTRLMRDNGYDFYWQDKYCQNLVAKQFVADDSRMFSLMTAFEVFEHLVEPMAEVTEMLRHAPSILFSTMIPPTRLENATQWWYLTPEHGQHISIYSVKSLQAMAEHFGLHFTTDGSTLHLLSQKPFPERLFRTIARNGRAAQMLRRVRRGRLKHYSLLTQDVRTVTGWNV